MIPVLYKNSRELGDVNYPNRLDAMGQGILTDCISCTVTEATDGQYEAQIAYPIDGRLYDKIQNGSIIGCDSDSARRLQPFIVYRRELNLDGTVTFYAHHVSYALNNVVFPSTASVTMAMLCAGSYSSLGLLHDAAIGRSDLIDDVYDGGNFSYTIDGTVEFAQPINIETPTTVRDIIKLIIEQTGCEVEYDRFEVIFHERRGSDNGVTVRYGGNLTDARQEYDTSGAYNGVVPYWVNSSDKTVFPSGSSQFLVEELISDSYRFPGQYKRRLVPLDLSDQFETQPTTVQLRTAANAHLEQAKPWVPFNSLTINFVPFEQDAEQAQATAAVQNARLYDTVRVVVPPMDADVTVRVIKTVYNVLLDRYDSLEVGQPQVTLSDVYGTVSASGKVSASAATVSDSLKVLSFQVFSGASIASQGVKTGTYTISASELDSNWTPVAIAGFNTDTRYASVYDVRMAAADPRTVRYGVYNVRTAASITCAMRVYVLCVRTSL